MENFFLSAASPLPSTRNSPYATGACFGVAYSAALQVLGLLSKQIVKGSVTKYGNSIYIILNINRNISTYGHPQTQAKYFIIMNNK